MTEAKKTTLQQLPYIQIPVSISERLNSLDDQDGHNNQDGYNGQNGHNSNDGHDVQDDQTVQDNHNSHNKFFAPRQTGKGLILPEDLFGGRHQNRNSLVLGMSFLTLSYADIWFAESSSRQRTRLQTTKWVELFSAKESAMVALGAYKEALQCIQHPSVAWSRRPRMSPL